MRTATKISFLSLGLSALAFGQSAVPSTTLSTALTASAQNSTVCLASTTNILYSQGNYGGLYVDLEYMRVTTAPANGCVTVTRGEEGTKPQAHAANQTVWIDQYNTNGIDTGFSYGTQQQPLYGPCTRANYSYLPRIHVGIADPFAIEDCAASTAGSSEFGSGVWTPYVFERTMFIGPGSCAWSTTGTYAAQVAVATGGPNIQGLTVVGASAIPANQISVTNGGASANTLTCWLTGDVFQPLLAKGVTITAFDAVYGVQTTALTSINGAAVGTITLPTPGASQTASTVTPVSVGGTLTSSSTTGNLATVTAGAFRTFRTTLGTPVNLSTDMLAIEFSVAFNQSASSAEILNTPGMLVHYTYNER